MTLENAAKVYSDYKQECAGPGSLPYKYPSNNYCSNPNMSGNRLPLIIVIFLIDAGIPLLNDLSTSILQDSCVL